MQHEAVNRFAPLLLLLLCSPCLAQEPPVPPLPPQPNVIDPTVPPGAPSISARLRLMEDTAVRLKRERQDIDDSMQFMRFSNAQERLGIDRLSYEIGQPLPSRVRILPPEKISAEAEPVEPIEPPEVADAPSLKLPLYVSGMTGRSIKVTATTNAKTVSWFVIDDALDLSPVEVQNTTLVAVVRADEPGSFRIAAFAAIGDQVIGPAICTVNVTSRNPPPSPPPGPGPQPPPGPGPPPVPPPTPPVVVSKVTVIIIDDKLRRTPANAALVADLSYWESLQSVVNHVHVVPAGDQMAKQYAAQVEAAGGIPCVILMAFPGNKVLTAERLPQDKVSMSALISKYTGKQ